MRVNILCGNGKSLSLPVVLCGAEDPPRHTDSFADGDGRPQVDN